jgi:hypothetical protein
MTGQLPRLFRLHCRLVSNSAVHFALAKYTSSTAPATPQVVRPDATSDGAEAPWPITSSAVVSDPPGPRVQRSRQPPPERQSPPA